MRLPLPTALGAKYLLFWAAQIIAFLAASYSNLFFLLIIFLSLLGLLSWFWTATNLRGVQAALAPIPPIPAGAGVEVGVEIEGGMEGAQLELRLEGVRGAQERIPPLARGLHPLTSAHLASAWPTGLFRSRLRLDAPEEIVVYPAPADLAECAAGGGLLEDLAGAQAGGLQPSGLREFRTGDEVRRIHWKASARRGDFVVTEWDGAAAGGGEILLDRRCASDALEESLSLIAAYGLRAREMKEALTLHTQGLSATFGGEQRPWEEFFRVLAGAQTLPGHAPPPPEVSPGTARLPR